MRQHLMWVVVGFALLVAIPGCGPNVSQSDLGTIVYEVPPVAGADEPYKYPDLPPLPPGSRRDQNGPPMDLPPPPTH